MNRMLASVALLLPLTGCWTSVPWFTASEAVNVVPDGHYRMESEEDSAASSEIVLVSRQPDGSLLLAGPDSPLKAIVVPLNPGLVDHQYIVQLEDPRLGAHKALFLLLDNRDQRYRVSVLPCEGKVAEIVERSGGSVSRDPQSAATCVFKDRETLVARLRRQAERAELADIELKRVGE